MSLYKKITGKNIYLSPNNVELAETYTKWINNKEIGTKIGNYSNNYTFGAERAYTDNHKTDNHNYAIVRLSDDKVIGSCGLKEVNHLHQKCEVGLFIGEEEDRGKGYGYETLSLLCDYAFNFLNMNSISLDYFNSNPSVKYCYDKVGFKDAGILRQGYYCHGKFYDVMRMDILKDEFNKNNEFSSLNK